MNVAETLAALAISQEADFPTWEVNLLEEGGLLAATAAPDLAPASASSRSSLASEQCPAEAARHVNSGSIVSVSVFVALPFVAMMA